VEAHGDTGSAQEDLRSHAIRRIKRKRDFYSHVVLFLIVNGALWVVWALTGDSDDVWPAWVSGIWGFFLLLEARHVYGDRTISEQDIQQEMGRLRGRG
jgi:hypothetical protein